VLEARNLHKKYKTKNGPVVKALDGVSIKFEETGMVFILGKSGSGKSTLLNVLGGLDSYDEGEVIVKGKSSKDFKQADFDSYRNTFIGFIFQDYNILEEFTISKNIGLALELQGKKADKKAINELMEQVDLKGYGKRKPNTLSGGQRQRVAIARALVKNPEIIMADEPTGALDSNTGKQVLDTLKKLSKTKLVLIVSHDREFAEQYGDRIIELADGKIISDVTKYKSAPKESEGLEIVDNKILTIKKGVKLDAKKTKVLNDFIANTEEDIIVSVDSKANKEFRKFAMIDEEGNKESFKVTDELKTKDYDPNKFKLIRSKLPGKDSFKMGASGLKTKPIRLFFTIILSALAFAMFGLADTMGSYDKVNNTIVSLKDSRIDYAAFTKEVEQGEEYKYFNKVKLSEADFTYLNDEMNGLHFDPVYSLADMQQLPYSNYLYTTEGISDYDGLYRSNIYGFVEIGEDNMSYIGNLVAGRLPSADDEIVITKYVYDIFDKGEYKEGSQKVEINNYEDILNKKLGSHYNNKEFKIVGIVDTECDLSRYSQMEEPGFGQSMTDYMLREEFNTFLTNSYHSLGYLNKGYYSRNVLKNSAFSSVSNNSNMSGNVGTAQSDQNSIWFNYVGEYNSELNNAIYYFENTKDSLLDNEIIISWNALRNIQFDVNGTQLNYDELTDRNCLENRFYNSYYAFMESIGLSNYNWEIRNNYGRFDFSTYTYDASAPLWINDYWMQSYNIILTPEQETQIDDYFKNYTKPTYCVDINEYFNNPEIGDKITNAYNDRYALDNTIGSIDTYKDRIYEYYKWNNWNYESPITSDEMDIANGLSRFYIEKIADYIPRNFFARYTNDYDYVEEFNIVGIYTGVVDYDNSSANGLISNKIFNELKDSLGGIYNFAIASLDYNNEELLRQIVEFNYKEGKVIYQLNNSVMYNMNEVNNLIETLSQVFVYVGLGFALFAALLLLNFITISISYKKREIGVLRAIGARGMDVFKIFFNEAFIIAFINFLLASIASVVTCIILNNMMRTDYGMLITVLDIGVRQVGLMFGVSLLVAFVSSFFPVSAIARKKPIDAIRNS